MWQRGRWGEATDELSAISLMPTKWLAAVRKTIHELGGTMPENLPVAESIKKVASRETMRLKGRIS
jgi:hypothetical protein